MVTGDLHVRFVKSVSCKASLDIWAWVLLSEGIGMTGPIPKPAVLCNRPAYGI